MGELSLISLRAFAGSGVLSLGMALALGCGGGSSGKLRGTTAVKVEAPAPTAARYETSASGDPVVGPSEEAAAVAQGVERAAKKHGTTLTADARLGLLAAWTAEHLGEGGTVPPHELVEFFAHHLGLVEPTPHVLVLGQPDPSTLTDGIADSVSQFLARAPYNHWGAAVITRQGLTLAVVVLTARMLELEPVPRAIAKGGSLSLRGRLGSGYDDPVVAVAMPSGDVSRQSAGSGKTIDVTLPTDKEGVYGVEVIAKGPRGDSVVANFPVFVGVDVPNAVSLGDELEDEGEPGDARQVRSHLLRLINRTRSEHALPPVREHEGLAEVATKHSQDMVSSGFVGHNSPTTGGAPDRVRRAGYASGLVLENIGRGYSASGIHDGLLKSPGHRANILNPDVTHVGVGVVGEEEGSRTAFVVTELFVRMASQIDTAAAPEVLLRKINKARHLRHAGPVELDPNLQEVAQEAADRFFAEPGLSQQDTVDDASSALRRFSIAFKRVSGLMTVVTTLEEATRLEPTFDAGVRYFGIGVAQGSRPDTPPNAIAVVIMMAWPRGE